jgi:hypothetical protein
MTKTLEDRQVALTPVTAIHRINGYDKEAQAELLMANDTGWLLAISNEPMTEEHIALANSIVAIGSRDLRLHRGEEERQEILDARDYFYGPFLGWANETDSAHRVYISLREGRGGLPPISTFIGSQRVLYDNGLDNRKIIEDCEETVRLTGRAAQSSIDNITNLGLPKEIINAEPTILTRDEKTIAENFYAIAGRGLDAVRMVTQRPRLATMCSPTIARKIANLDRHGLNGFGIVEKESSILTLAEHKVDKRMYRLGVYSLLLGWKGSITELIELSPRILGMSDAKFRVHMHLFNQHGSSDLSEKEIKRFMISDLESHIITLAQGKEYTPANVSQTAKKLKDTERQAKIETILEIADTNQELQAKISKYVIAAYKAYAKEKVRRTK